MKKSVVIPWSSAQHPNSPFAGQAQQSRQTINKKLVFPSFQLRFIILPLSKTNTPKYAANTKCCFLSTSLGAVFVLILLGIAVVIAFLIFLICLLRNRRPLPPISYQTPLQQ